MKFTQFEITQADRTNAFLTDLLIRRFSDLLGGLDAVECSEELEKELKSVIKKITPVLPFLGILSAGATVGKHALKHRNGSTEKSRVNKSCRV